jgi:hypothetical protein
MHQRFKEIFANSIDVEASFQFFHQSVKSKNYTKRMNRKNEGVLV